MQRSVRGVALAAALILGACGGGGASDKENEVSPSGVGKFSQQTVDVWEGSMHSEGFLGHRRRNGVVYYSICTGNYDARLRLVVSQDGVVRGEAKVSTEGKKCKTLSKGLSPYHWRTGAARCVFGIQGELGDDAFEIRFIVDPIKTDLPDCGVGFDPFGESNFSGTHEIPLTAGARADTVEVAAGPGAEPQIHGTSKNTIHLSRTCTRCVNPTP
jgi:hypothetical protein